jgi:3',5'-cyclic AMP phosphodiesterase CpdA
MRRIVHISDVHFGVARKTRIRPLIEAIHRAEPDLVIVSGDLVQFGFPREFRQARWFLEQLPKPMIVVPGNHDVPMSNPLVRFVTPMSRFQKYISKDLAPFYLDNEIAVQGINTAHAFTMRNGKLTREHMRIIEERLCPLPDEITKIIVMHHPIDQAMEFGDHELVKYARKSMDTLARCGADLCLSGHMHIGYSGSTQKRYTMSGYAALVVQAGTALSARERESEPNSFNVIYVEHPKIQVDRWWWDAPETSYQLYATESFEHTKDGWMASSDIKRESTIEATREQIAAPMEDLPPEVEIE